MIDITSADWTEYEESATIAVLKKIAYCQDQKKPLPVAVFEAHCKSKKNIATELVLFNGEGEIYLVKRPSLEENPNEPYSDQWHNPGVTHNKNESLEDALERLRQSEGLKFSGVEEISHRDSRDDKRGRYLSCIFIANGTGAQINPRGRFFRQGEIPWDELVSAQRETIIPAALEAYNKRKSPM
ncbi:MAG: hypothetical protein Q8P35_00815 [Candidatus Yanofskybacteria bacterium]|nr:hypothetical protein [Candidatus Yanofskybacteria bacterium]